MGNASEIKPDRRYTKEHEWAKPKGDEAVVVGVTAFAVDQLGDITLVNFDVAVGDRVEAGKVFGTIESVKTLSDLYSPVSGEVVGLNGALENGPELINEDCWDKGWMLEVRCDDPSEVNGLLDAEGYRTHTEES
jgi:glycine cleavage system H protein